MASHIATRGFGARAHAFVRRIGCLLIVVAAWLLPSTQAPAALPCNAQARTATLPIAINVPRGTWLQAELAEDGSDWVLQAVANPWRLETDTAPSRLAVEHLTLPGSIFPTITVDARTWTGEGLRKPDVSFSCMPWDPSFMPRLDLMWGGAWLVTLEGSHDPTAAARLDRQARRHFARVMDQAAGPAVKAAARHTMGYLLTRGGHSNGAATAFDAAAELWKRAGHRGAELMARFNAAQARLNGGSVATAAAALESLSELSELDRWPFLRGWVANDRCVARRELDDWDFAAACFARLAEQFQSRGLTRESALARCNRLAALAGGRRWREASEATTDCVEHQFASGSAGGRAQALHLRGWVRLHFGEIRDGIEDLAAALELLDGSGDSPMAWQVRSLLAGAWLVLDEAPRAIAMLQTGLAKFPATRDPATHARLTHELARIERWAHAPEAAAMLASARDQYAALGWVRLQNEVTCELASAGWAQSPDDCPIGLARAQLNSGQAPEVLRRALSADAGSDWSTALLWLELAIDAATTSADLAAAQTLLQGLIDRSQALDESSELTRRMRAAVHLELAGAAAALVAAGAPDELAWQSLALLRSAGPPMSSARSVLYGATTFSPSQSLAPQESTKVPGRPAPLLRASPRWATCASARALIGWRHGVIRSISCPHPTASVCVSWNSNGAEPSNNRRTPRSCIQSDGPSPMSLHWPPCWPTTTGCG